MPKDGEVGYQNPPSWTRFKPGKSGNPNGRPRRSADSVSTLVLEALTAPVSVRETGRRRKITQFELILRATVEQAKAGDLDAAAFVLQAIKAARRAGTLGPGVIRVVNWLPDMHDPVATPLEVPEPSGAAEP